MDGMMRLRQKKRNAKAKKKEREINKEYIFVY